ncbi:GNAT family N-acetyltransferase [Streptomyces sp. DSM 44915]|uniref:GNAT family N-acetyltransferase n=1 Tax=Streptomyces chisholmiae TaxID=3075540 RepID=A0ABU2JPH0_9ACTN|nr:GNAT family N-acetyltransferase [Streptomyces sp. DSM 44915]MDT0266880.1 GNAT family N-acetyltransferase [Streptomyces sp. DSM 44915]
MHLRTATEEDLPFLTDALLLAYDWTGAERFSREELLADPNAAHYVVGWPAPGEFGVLAEDPATGVPVGAAWARLLPADDPGYGYVAPDVPELTLGVVPDWRGRGVGKALLDALLAAAVEHGHRRISLSVEDGNRAVELYRSRGFTPVGRVGGADTMLREL